LYNVQFDNGGDEMIAQRGSSEESLTGVASEVPFVAFPPEGGPRVEAPVVVAWHLLDAPRTESAFAAALPLAGLDAWRIYLGLPMTGARMPAGGPDEFLRLGFEDAVLNIHGPINEQALREFGPAFDEIRGRLDIGAGPLGVMGGSLGASIALRVIAESGVAVDAAVLVSPMIRMRSVVAAMEGQYGITYEWSDGSEAVADRIDFVARADQVAGPPVLLVVGEEDDVPGFRDPAAELRDALVGRGDDGARVELVIVPGMGHALAEEPGIEPAPQTAHAAEVDGRAVEWFRRYLTS
jgi:dienelactone hydrolase